jgi:hypothetical protein
MKLQSYRIFCAALAMVLITTSTAVAENDVGGASQQAAEHFRRGIELADQGLFESALEEFLRANDIAPRFQVLYNVAQTLRILGRTQEAADTFRRYLSEGSDAIDSARRQEVERLLGRLDRDLASSPLALPSEKGVPRPAVGSSPIEQDEPKSTALSPAIANRSAVLPLAIADESVVSRRPPPLLATPDIQSASKLREPSAATWTLAAGITTGALTAAGVALLVWNQQRYHRWKQEDAEIERLSHVSDMVDDHMRLLDRQERNDRLLESVRHSDRITLGIAAGATLSGAATAWLLIRSLSRPVTHSVQIGRAGAHVGWTTSW